MHKVVVVQGQALGRARTHCRLVAALEKGDLPQKGLQCVTTR